MAQETTAMTQRIFESTHRPYIGINEINFRDEASKIGIELIVKNFGTVPAHRVEIRTQMKLDGELIDISNTKGNQIILQPGLTTGSVIHADRWFIDDLAENGKTLTMQNEIRYRGPSNLEYQCNYHYEYSPRIGGFFEDRSEEIKLPT